MNLNLLEVPRKTAGRDKTKLSDYSCSFVNYNFFIWTERLDMRLLNSCSLNEKKLCR